MLLLHVKPRYMHGHDFFLKKQPIKDTLAESAPLFIACGVLLAIEALLPTRAAPKAVSPEEVPAMLEQLAEEVKGLKPNKDSSAAKDAQEVINHGPLYDNKPTSNGPVTAATSIEILENIHFESVHPDTCMGCDTCYNEGYHKGYTYGHDAASHRGWAYYGHEVEKKTWSQDFSRGFGAGCQKGYKDAWFLSTTSS